jgi:hypothetical protein
MKREFRSFQKETVKSAIRVFPSFFKTAIVSFALVSNALIFSEELNVSVQDPVYKDGILSSESGGVISSSKLRVQAKNLELKEVNGEKILTAKDDLFLVYGKKTFVGNQFSYNFTTKQGVLNHGVCNTEGLFVDGAQILFNSDGTVKIDKAYLTTSDNKETSFMLKAKDVSLDEEFKMKANNITLSAFDTPVMYLPTYSRKVNKKFIEESSLTYKTMWEKGQGPLFVTRYKAYDANGLKVHVRGELRSSVKGNNYFIPRGAGTALEIDYAEPDKKLFKIASRNFYSYDTFYNDNNPNKSRSRYRLQGSFSGFSENKKIETFGRWDALSDRNMRSDFPTQLFQLQTLERTEGYVKARYDSAFTSIYVRPRINTFQGFKQELPTFKMALKPYKFESTGLIFENTFKAAYLDYAYADSLKGAVPDFGSGRVETNQILSRPFNLGVINVSPELGFKGIFYSNTKTEEPNLQTLFGYNLKSHASFEKFFSSFSHEAKPYFEFRGLTTPTIQSKDIYIFSVQDGYKNINELKLGFKNSFFSSSLLSPIPGFTADLFTYSFLNSETLKSPVSKAYLDMNFNLNKAILQTSYAWNFEKNVIDHINHSLSMTFNEYFAASLELRHRGKYEWKKDNFYNFMLDAARPIDQLASSPLSDERTTFLARWQLQLTPLSMLQVQNQIGWRPNQPFYHESKIDFYTTITNTWKLRLSYMRTVRTNQYSFELNLI